jgi:SAM-dependent methyltransferase
MTISAPITAARSAGIPYHDACRSCGSTALRTIYRVPNIPVHSCILLGSAEEARAFPRRDLELAFCDACGFVFNRIFDEQAMGYSTNFEESQHFSGTFNAFARQLAREIAERCEVAGKHVLEIGCGKGEFLRELCSAGGAFGLGIDPGFRGDPGRVVEDDGLRFIVDHFGPDYVHLEADIILCRHTLEHIAPVAEFLGALRDMAGDDGRAVTVFETPDVKRVLEEAAFWDIYYEHCSYFSPGTHARAFRRRGFEITGLELVYAGQYIVQYARPVSGPPTDASGLEDDLAEMRRLAEDFPARVAACQQAWRDRIRDDHADGRRIVLWGGGSKAVSLLTTLGLGDEISAAVDINPYKQGKFTPGSAHPVIAPEALAENPPDLVIVMNPIYVPEVERTLASFGLSPEVVGL